ALINDQKELVLPIVLTGSFDHLQVVPDLQEIAQMKAQNRLPTAGKPNEFTSSMLEGLAAGKSTNQPGVARSKTSRRPRGTQAAHNPKRRPARQVSVADAKKHEHTLSAPA